MEAYALLFKCRQVRHLSLHHLYLFVLSLFYHPFHTADFPPLHAMEPVWRTSICDVLEILCAHHLIVSWSFRWSPTDQMNKLGFYIVPTEKDQVTTF